MNSKGCGSVPLLLARISLGSTSLPFLYQTRTLQPCRTCVKKGYRAQSSTTGATSRRRFYDGTENPDATIPFEKELAFPKTRSSFSYNDNGQAGEDLFRQPNQSGEGRPQRNSTITASEKAVFERIFREISEDDSRKAAEEEDPLADDPEDDLPSRGNAYNDLNAIFESALQQDKQRKVIEPHPQINRTHPGGSLQAYETALEAFSKPARKRLDIATISEKRHGERRLDIAAIRDREDFQKIRTMITEHEQKVLGKIDEARSDMQIWQVLEEEVFPLVRQYESHQLEAEKEKEAKLPRRKRGRVSKADQEAAAEAEKNKHLRARAKSAQEAEVQSILSSNYGNYCLAAMRRLRRLYPTSPYCMNLLPTIKRLGPISHVLAASADLYNEILFLLWKEYSDLHAMADLIIEMENQGIESNDVTLHVLRMVRSARNGALKEDKPMKLWWELSPVSKGWSRLRDLANQVHRQIVEAKARQAEEERSLTGGMDVESGFRPREFADEETSIEQELKTKTAMADEATNMDGGLGTFPSQRAGA
ncbi:MAG: hypothetical protein Q9222_001604 [Ikaeria aurantiellina]